MASGSSTFVMGHGEWSQSDSGHHEVADCQRRSATAEMRLEHLLAFEAGNG